MFLPWRPQFCFGFVITHSGMLFVAGTGQTKDHKLVLACYFVVVSFLCLCQFFLFCENHTCILFIHVHMLSVLLLLLLLLSIYKLK